MDTQYYDRLQRMAQTYNPESCVPTPLRGTERTTVYKTGFVMARWALNGLVSIISRVRNIQKVYVKDEELRWHACSESLKSYSSLKGKKEMHFVTGYHSGIIFRPSIQGVSVFHIENFRYRIIVFSIPIVFPLLCYLPLFRRILRCSVCLVKRMKSPHRYSAGLTLDYHF